LLAAAQDSIVIVRTVKLHAETSKLNQMRSKDVKQCYRSCLLNLNEGYIVDVLFCHLTLALMNKTAAKLSSYPKMI